MSGGQEQTASEMQMEIARMRVELNRLRAKYGEMDGCGHDVEALFLVAERMGYSRTSICSSGRTRGGLFYSRCAIAYELRKKGFTLIRIGGILNRDHSSIVAGLRRYNECVENPKRDRDFAEFIREFENNLNERRNERD